MPSRIRFLVAALAAMSLASNAHALFDECRDAADPGYTVGFVDCQKVPATPTLGGTSAISYYVPPACAVAGRQCPVLYYFHGTGGTYREFVGAKTGLPPTAASIKALTSGPPVDPRRVPDPWNYGTSTWIAAPPLDLIIVVSHSRTLPGGYGPIPDLDPVYSDWNPRYAQGGDQEKYATPPPLFDTHFVTEIIPFVESHLPAGKGREWRAYLGISEGGFGSLVTALRHPDLVASFGSISGGALPLALTSAIIVPGVVGLQPPVQLPYQPLPGPVAGIAPEQAAAALDAFDLRSVVYGWGDPVADHAYWQENTPDALATNGRASRAGDQSQHIRFYQNDSIPRRVEDLQDSGYPLHQAYETATLQTSNEMARAFTQAAVEYHYEIHPGLHWTPYWVPFYRQQLSEQYARVKHWDGSGSPPPAPDRFDYRSIYRDFDVWGWTFHVVRDPVEFLDLTDVTCSGLTLRGTGTVTVTVAASCGTGVNHSAIFVQDLGPSFPVDEPAGAGAQPIYGRTVHVDLAPL